MDAPLELTGTKDIRIDVSEFRGETRVDIRRWYQDRETGEWKRGNKGINMSIDEWDFFIDNIDDIKSYIRENK